MANRLWMVGTSGSKKERLGSAPKLPESKNNLLGRSYNDFMRASASTAPFRISPMFFYLLPKSVFYTVFLPLTLQEIVRENTLRFYHESILENRDSKGTSERV